MGGVLENPCVSVVAISDVITDLSQGSFINFVNLEKRFPNQLHLILSSSICKNMTIDNEYVWQLQCLMSGHEELHV